jgi:peroxiredoxin
MRGASTATVAIALAALLFHATPADAQQPARAADLRAPAILLTRLDGTELDLGRYVGETPIVLHFFAAWCSQCRQQMPSLQAAIERYGKSVKFVGVAVSANQSLERAKRYAASHRMTHDIVYDARGTAVDRFNVATTSYVIVVDRNGRIVFTGSGGDLDVVDAVRRSLGLRG